MRGNPLPHAHGFELSWATGLSGTALPLVPMLAILLAFARLAEERPTLATLRTVLLYGLSQAWVLMVGAAMAITVQSTEVDLVGFHGGFPDNFRDQFYLVFSSPTSATLLFAAANLLAGVALADWPRRRFFLAWLGTGAVLFFNPLVFPLVARHLTSYNIYWRILYVLPFPLLLRVTSALTAQRLRLSARALGLASGVAVVLAVGLTLRYPAHRVLGPLPFRPATHKVEPDIRGEVEAIVRYSSAGPMVAPVRHRIHLLLYDADRPMLLIRSATVYQSAHFNRQWEFPASRMRAVRFVEGLAPEGLPDFVKALEDGVRTVVLDSRMADDPAALHALREHGFAPSFTGTTFRVYVKAGAG